MRVQRGEADIVMKMHTMKTEITRIQQTITGPKGNCFAACVSMVTGIPLEDIPNFSESKFNWHNHFYKWAQEQGYHILAFFPLHSVLEQDLTCEDNGYPIIVTGVTETNSKHAVVQFNKKIIDPQPSQAGLLYIHKAYVLIPKDKI